MSDIGGYSHFTKAHKHNLIIVAMTQTQKKRELLTKKPFYRVSPDTGQKADLASEGTNIGEQAPIRDNMRYQMVTQEDFLREFDPNAHAINDPEIYQNWMQRDEDGLYYETQWERHAFAFQQEILEDRLVRLTANDIQFDLSDRMENEQNNEAFYKFKATWAEKSMSRAWYEGAKSTLTTGDAAFVGILDNGKFYWRVLSFLKGDTLYPHYDRYTGKLSVFARTYTEFGTDGELHDYIDAWDDKFYYRMVADVAKVDITEDGDDSRKQDAEIGDFIASGYAIEEKKEHGFNKIPVAYVRKDAGPCWSNSQEAIEHYELAFSRLAQSNSAFGLPILGLTTGSGKKIEELSMGDMSYAAKIFLIPSEGKAEFLQRQDASSAYKAQLDELKRKIYDMSMVVKAPELKSGDTPAAAIKLLYSDSYNKGMNETMEFDEFIDEMVEIFSWGAGVETNNRLAFTNLPLSHYIIVFIPVSENELTTILATAVQNGFCSKQTASEKFPYATPAEWYRCKQEKHEEQMQELLLMEQKLDVQNSANVEMQEDLADIQVQQQTQVAEAQADIESGEKKTARKVQIRKGSGSAGGRRGRPNMSGAQWDANGNEVNPMTGRAYSKWDKWNSTH